MIVRERGTDGSYLYVGQFGEARVVHPTAGQIYGGKYDPTRNGFQFGRDGTTPNYDNLTPK